MYVPFAVLAPAWIVAVLVVLVDPDTNTTEAGERLQVEPAGAPVQESATVPVKLFLDVMVTFNVVCCPALTVFEAGAEIEKSVTACVTPTDVPELKFVSPP